METPGIIFDMDDTLVVTTPLWRAAKGKLLLSIGHPEDTEIPSRLRGLSALDFAAALHKEYLPDLPLADFQKRFRELLIGEFRSTALRPVAGVVNLVQRCVGRGNLAVASGSPLDAIQFTLSYLGLGHCFDVLLSSESVRWGKPHPEVFLTAARQLHVRPEACIVFEDSLVGAQAAHAAKMKAIVRPSSPGTDFSAYATRVCSSWSDITDDYLTQIMAD